MPGKRPAASQAAPRRKKQRKVISIGMKLEVISLIEKGERIADIGHVLGLTESTVRTIRDNATKIKGSATSATSGSASKTSYARSSLMEKMERALAEWIEDRYQRELPVTMSTAQSEARSIYQALAKNVKDAKPFKASTGWFANFKKRYNFLSIKMTGETAELSATELFVATLKATIDEGGYSPKQVFNLDETSLFWKRLPSKTNITLDEEQCVPSFEVAKDRLTLLLGGNAEGDCKLKPVMVYHSANPPALKGYAKNRLPVHFYSNPKGWITGSLFCDYLASELQDELREYCSKQNLEFKTLLLVENAPGQPASIQDLGDNIKLVLLPPDTSLVHPMEQGVFDTFKAHYLKRIFEMMLKATEVKKLSVKEFWEGFSIRDAVTIVGEAWKAVSRPCMNSVWEKLCPYLVRDVEGFVVNDDVARTKKIVVELGKKVGFDEVDLEDVVRLLNSHKEELSADELLQLEKEHQEAGEEEEEREATEAEVLRAFTRERLVKAFRLIEKGLTILDKDDPNTERSSNVSRNVLDHLRCYSDILREKRAKAIQETPHPYSKEKEPQPSTSSSASNAQQQPVSGEEAYSAPTQPSSESAHLIQMIPFANNHLFYYPTGTSAAAAPSQPGFNVYY